MISLKDYAKECGVTYEAVRQQVKRYQTDLEGHIHRQGKTQYLDDAAVAILDSHRSEKPMVVYEAGYDRLAAENEELKRKLEQARDKIIDVQDRLLIAEGAQARLEAAEVQQKLLMEARDDYKAEAVRARAEAEQLRNELEAAKARELALKSRGFFARLLRKGE